MTDKQQALVSRPDNLENRLFFQARNLAIESLLLRIEVLFLRESFPVSCHWREDSRYSPSIEIRFHNQNKSAAWEYGTATIWVERDIISVYDRDQVSQCYYTLKSVSETEYWGGKEPKKLLDFRARVKELGEQGYFEEEILKINFPFDRKSLSSF